jgi:hypothetical protein
VVVQSIIFNLLRMGEILLYSAVGKNIPLIEVVVEFVEGIDYEDATEQLNALAEDFHLNWHPTTITRVGVLVRPRRNLWKDCLVGA